MRRTLGVAGVIKRKNEYGVDKKRKVLGPGSNNCKNAWFQNLEKKIPDVRP